MIIVGDVHLGKKLYENHSSWVSIYTEIIYEAFERLVRQIDDDVIFAGDFFDKFRVDTRTMKEAIKGLSNIRHTVYILGGNHDVARTYDTVGSLDILAELDNVVVINKFKMETYEIGDSVVTFIPHVKSQKEFNACIKSVPESDLVVVHASIGDKPDYIESDKALYLSIEDAEAMPARYVLAGHEHKPRFFTDKVVQLGSLLPLGPREVTDHFIYHYYGKTLSSDVFFDVEESKSFIRKKTFLKPPKTVDEFIEMLDGMTAKINFLYIKNVPSDKLRALKSIYEAYVLDCDRVVMVYFNKQDDSPEEGSLLLEYKDVSFNLRTELSLFAEANQLPVDQFVRLQEALDEVLKSVDEEV